MPSVRLKRPAAAQDGCPMNRIDWILLGWQCVLGTSQQVKFNVEKPRRVHRALEITAEAEKAPALIVQHCFVDQSVQQADPRLNLLEECVRILLPAPG